MTPSRILVLGAGGREHALAWRLARDPHRPTILVAPGNDGMGDGAVRLAVDESDADALVRTCRSRDVGLVVVGPEGPLAAGVADALRAAGIATFGPSRGAARLESSKWFAKEVMREAGIPTAAAAAFETSAPALARLRASRPPFVVKADGLAAGKGVLVTSDAGEAERFVLACLVDGRFGEGGRRVVIEEHLTGEEASIMAVCDGRDFVLLPPARDYKRAEDGDGGPNTGGMGSFAPTPSVTPELERAVGETVVAPLLRAMAARGVPFAGALYVGLMLTKAGPRVVEFNVRFGDPETQSIVPLLTGSFTRLLASAAAGALERDAVGRAAGAAVTVAVVDEGYPSAPRGDGVLEGLDRAEAAGAIVFHAGTRRDGARWRVSGGRAAYVTATGDSVDQARAGAYDALGRLSGTHWRARRDIAGAGSAAAHPSGA